MKDLGSLNEEQRDFIKSYIKRTPSDLWLEKLTELKGIEAKKAESEDQVLEALEQWELIEIKAAAGDKRPYKCMCGRSLKYQYIVTHKKLDMTYKLGSECIKRYTGIDGSLAKKVLLEGRKINALLDEILEKMETSEHKIQKILLNEERLPEKLKKQLALGLPLGEKQLKRALKEQPKWRRESKEILESLSDQQLDYLGDLKEGDKYSVIVTLKSGEKLFDLQSLKDLDLSLVAHQSPDKLKPVHGEVTSPKIDRVKATKSIIQDEAIGVIGSKLSKEQRQFWRSKLSFNQRKEIAVHMLNDMYSLDQDAIDLSLLKPRLREQVRLGFPLTVKQWTSLGLPIQEEKE